jgi:hypothetical protein
MDGTASTVSSRYRMDGERLVISRFQHPDPIHSPVTCEQYLHKLEHLDQKDLPGRALPWHMSSTSVTILRYSLVAS